MPEQYFLADQYIYTEIAVRAFGKMAKRQYKIHANGHGIEVWKCEDCSKELNNIETRNNKKRLCLECKDKRRKERDMTRYYNKKKELESKKDLTDGINAIRVIKAKHGGVQIDRRC